MSISFNYNNTVFQGTSAGQMPSFSSMWLSQGERSMLNFLALECELKGILVVTQTNFIFLQMRKPRSQGVGHQLLSKKSLVSRRGNLKCLCLLD